MNAATVSLFYMKVVVTICKRFSEYLKYIINIATVSYQLYLFQLLPCLIMFTVLTGVLILCACTFIPVLPATMPPTTSDKNKKSLHHNQQQSKVRNVNGIIHKSKAHKIRVDLLSKRYLTSN